METLCKEIKDSFLSEKKEDKSLLFGLSSELSGVIYFEERADLLKDIQCLIELERVVISNKGKYKKNIESAIFSGLEHIATNTIKRKCSQRPLLSPLLSRSEKNPQEKIIHQAAQTIKIACIEFFHFKQPRDSYRSLRQQAIIEIFYHLFESYDVPEVLPLCQEALKSGKKHQVIAAIEFYKRHMPYFSEEENQLLLKKIEAIPGKTKSRSIAVAALDYQIAAGYISELGALSKMDVWKERNELEHHG